MTMTKTQASIWAVLAAIAPAAAQAQFEDFNAYTVDSYPATSGFATPNWEVSDDGRTAGETGNSYMTFLAGGESILNKIVSGVFNPGTDDDMPGLAFGYSVGDVDNPDADYLLLDWKGVTQSFDFADTPDSGVVIHDLTPGTEAPAGLALSRVTGIPTADELWGHVDFETENPDGGVEELARGAVYGAQSYNRAAGGQDYNFVVIYEEDRVQVRIDGVLEFDLEGSFPDGGFALYESHQSPGSTFFDWTITDIADPGDFNFDGSVDLLDYGILADNFLTGVTFAQGDNNFDGVVDHFDFVEFVDLYAAANPAAAVPEPAAWVMALCLATGAVAWTRRRRA